MKLMTPVASTPTNRPLSCYSGIIPFRLSLGQSEGEIGAQIGLTQGLYR